jgi:hypothetical protein
MQGASGGNYVHYSAMKLDDGFSRMGAMMDEVSRLLGARDAEIWGAWVPSVNSLFSDATYYLNQQLPNPFPYLVGRQSWSGDPWTILSEAMDCSHPRGGSPNMRKQEMQDLVATSSSEMDAILFPADTYEDVVGNGTSILAPQSFWNMSDGWWHKPDGTLDTSAEVQAILASGQQFVVVTQMLKEWLGTPSPATLQDVLDIAKGLQDAGVTLVTVGQLAQLKQEYYDLTRGRAFRPFLLGADQWVSAPGLGLYMQRDGNLVLYDAQGPLWASGTWTGPDTCGPGCFAAFQEDGNLVVYMGGGAVWASGTWGCGDRLILSSTAPFLSVSNGARSCAVR